MRLGPFRHRKDYLERSRGELKRLVLAGDQRPCERCDVRCSCPKRSSSCNCLCQVDCEMAPRMLSSDHEYPLEARIVPLVYQLNALGVVQSCWSCEGHQDRGRRLLKPPRVWFYSPCVSYVGLISEYLSDLHCKKMLHFSWHVTSLGTWGEAECPRFSLEPKELAQEVSSTAPKSGERSVLERLQLDVERISGSLKYQVRELAQRELSRLDASH